MSGLEAAEVIFHLGKALYSLKCKYDLHKENQHEINELQAFIEQYEALLPDLQRSFRQCKGNPAGDAALQQLEDEITKALRTIQRWSTSTTFFTMLASPQRLTKIQKLHRSLMMATQKHLSIASISMLLDIRTDQANLRGDLTSDLKSLLISGMADMSQTVARQVRIAASEASRASYADEKFWADVLGALEPNANCTPGQGDEAIPDRFLDPILADVMVDPILASNGITYCRWTILDNHMTRDPHNPNENLTILGDNVSLRSELFERFPELCHKFRQRRSEYRSEALSLATRGQLADAMVSFQHVLRWDKKDPEISAALAQVQANMKEAKSRQAQPSSSGRKLAAAPPEMVLPKVSSSDRVVVPDSSSTSSSVVTAQVR